MLKEAFAALLSLKIRSMITKRSPAAAILCLFLLGPSLLAAESITESNRTITPAYGRAPDEAAVEDADLQKRIGNAIALLNLLLVISIYLKSRHDRKADQSERSSLVEAEISNFWIQRLTLEPGLPTLNAFFQTWEKELADFIEKRNGGKVFTKKQVVNLEGKIDAFKDGLDELRVKIVDPLRVISPLFDDVDLLFDDVEDVVVTNLAQTVCTHLESDPVKNLQELRRKIFSALHSIQRELVRVPFKRKANKG